MAYASITHVAILNFARAGTRGYDATSIPNGSQVSIFLDQIAAEIDLKLRTNGYILPVPASASSGLKLCEDINAKGAAWMVEIAAPTSDNVAEYQTMYQNALSMLSKSDLDIPKDPGTGLPRGAFGSTDPIVATPSSTTTLLDF